MAKKRALSERDLEIQRVAASGNASELAVLLHSGFHHGKNGASQAEKVLAAKTILETFGKQGEQLPKKAPEPSKASRGEPADTDSAEETRLLTITRELAASYAPSARQVACALMQELWIRDRALTPLMIELTLDEDWEVREWAAGAYAAKLRHEFPANVAFFHELLEAHPHESVLRQTALAIKQTAQARIPNSTALLLDLTDKLMTSEAEYVRKNLGPFAIGDGLLRVCPDETLPYLKNAARRPEWPSRWNALMSFSAAQGARHADTVFELLTLLEHDPQREIRRAVLAVAKNLAKRLPEDTRFASFFMRM
ncbi:hypothetical protein [Tumebacillus flagellatus]|uniref:HEAT repeat domain-containing protein n=1 Tax=Tumebacillus flagellatus TaxID=1157490 RepID=A0A074LPG3_9BACL|nr:hypothetical protein [Tumebacillus flagellatus]KEO82385.1 hypothetical protein EL26_15795 [Tumebacillus flagellatus]